MVILASIGLVLLVAIAAAGARWVMKTIRFNDGSKTGEN